MASIRVARNSALDGLRGVAALAVLWFHASTNLELIPQQILGFAGVEVFFVLSGYLLARVFCRTVSRPQPYWQFVGRRLERLIESAVLAITLTTAFARASGRYGDPVLGVTWSLTVEWAFYLSYPALFLVVRRIPGLRQRAAFVNLGVGLALWAVSFLLTDTQFYFLPVANLGVMFLGASLGVRHEDGGGSPAWLCARLAPFAGLLALACTFVIPGTPEGPVSRYLVFPVVAVATLAVIVACEAGSSPVCALLAARPLRFVGTRAYSLYLWHLSVLWLLRLTTEPSPLRPLLAAVLIAGVVDVSFRVFEAPALSRPSGATRGPTPR